MAETPEWLKFEFYLAGTVLLEQGTQTGRLVVLRDGEIEVLRDGTFIASTRSPGAIFGEMSLLLEKPHTATVRAVSDVECYVIHDALKVLATHPAWTLQIARLLAQRVNNTTAALMAARPEAVDDDQERLIMPHYVLSDWGDPQV
ncbi:MAG: Crp/Fnr family transcriptional regulator [Devosia sp.]|jgi:CRP/FNR family cyclic AMP-dependent transcriptional regulator|uniref:Crp/Fnr family transcriptional regulator n=1 Tax=Devosia sp. TaxID=1871048 RepID=UPI0037C017DD